MKINVINISGMRAKVEIEHNNKTITIPDVRFSVKDGEAGLEYEGIVAISEAVDMNWKIANTGQQMTVAMNVLNKIRQFRGEKQ